MARMKTMETNSTKMKNNYSTNRTVNKKIKSIQIKIEIINKIDINGKGHLKINEEMFHVRSRI